MRDRQITSWTLTALIYTQSPSLTVVISSASWLSYISNFVLDVFADVLSTYHLLWHISYHERQTDNQLDTDKSHLYTEPLPDSDDLYCILALQYSLKEW